MRWQSIVWTVAFVVVAAALVTGGIAWQRGGWSAPAPATAHSAAPHDHPPAADATRVELSPQARANLQMTSQPLRPETFWKVIQLPGKVVDRPGLSDRGVVTPIAGVVTQVHRYPGDTVRSGQPLFTVRLLGEAMQLAQTELLKATREIEITEEMRSRLKRAAAQGGIPKIRITEMNNDLRRLAVAQRAYRLELATRGLTPQQIEQIGTGRFVTEMVVAAPPRKARDAPGRASDAYPNLFEVQELKVELGQQVRAGQLMCVLSHHQHLYVEGRAFRKELPLLERSISQSWPVDVEFMDDQPQRWPQQPRRFAIRHVSNAIDQASRTFAFFLPLDNQCRSYESNGHVGLLWRYRPGQRVRVRVRSEKLDDVFVLPAAAVVREGPETYVFRQDGDFFDRKPVHVLYQDRRDAVIANDGSVPAGIYVAATGAAQLNRVLKSAVQPAAAAHGHPH